MKDNLKIVLRYIKSYKGHFPKASNEAVVEKWVLNNMGLKSEINQDLTLNICY